MSELARGGARARGAEDAQRAQGAGGTRQEARPAAEAQAGTGAQADAVEAPAAETRTGAGAPASNDGSCGAHPAQACGADPGAKAAGSQPVRLTLPLSREALADLRAGDEVLLSGPVFTMRDAGHERALAALDAEGALPFGLDGATLFYAGPTPAAAGRPLGSVGPTTASRMDFATPRLMEAGIIATIGKGKRSAAVAEACRATGGVYLCAIGGIAALLATHVTASELVAWDDLGTEALRRLELADFPAFVAVDATGADLYRQVEAAAR